MTTSPVLPLPAYFAKLKDPRIKRRRKHLLVDIVVVAICGVIADCDNWQELELWARHRLDWFRGFLSLPHGIPSHDTFERVFDRLNPRVFSACFQEWVQAICGVVKLKQVAIDGKTLCGSFASSKNLGPLHLVSAWATEQKLSLAELAVDNKSNEITAIPKLLALLDVKGALVSIDAMGCQKEIAQTIVDAGADYLLTVKKNQGRLYDDLHAVMEQALDDDLPASAVDTYEWEKEHHGRVDRQRIVVVRELAGVRDRELWPELATVGMCYSEREVKGETKMEARYFISSRKLRAKRAAEGLRNHWGIENHLHWTLDVSFDEDGSRIQSRNGAENFALLRRMAVSLLKQYPSKRSIKGRRKEASLSPEILEEILAANQNPGKL
jgi:predicted transposase YbfD/YdcC